MKYSLLLLIVLVGLSVVGYGDYAIVWHTIDGGGGTSSGGNYQLTGTIGQPDAGYHDGGQYELLGGFWTGGPLCIVDLEHFAAFAAHWLDGPCDASNNRYAGANCPDVYNPDQADSNGNGIGDVCDVLPDWEKLI